MGNTAPIAHVVVEPPTDHYIKIYPDRFKIIQFRRPYSTFSGTLKNKKTGRSWILTEDERLDYLSESLRRSKTRITDIVICNQFELFVTFTINCRACIPKCKNKPCTCDKKTCKRYDLDYCIRTQKAWYNNQIKKYGRFPYLQVMELHKDKKGYHFHAVFKDYKGPLKPWKIDKDGRMIYNLASNKKGWTTVKEIYDVAGASSYIRKYITKDMPLFPGKKRFWASQGLLRPVIIQDDDFKAELMLYPNKQVWQPPEAELRENGTVRQLKTILESITTIEADNKALYNQHLKWLKQLDAVRSGLGLPLPATATSHINSTSQARGLQRLTKDSPAL